MDYKKILAATTVTSAAIVVPVVAQAEETVEVRSDLFDVNSSYNYGEKITAVDKLTVTSGETTVEVDISSYEWNIKYANGTTKKLNVITKELEIPKEAHGAKIELVVKDENGAVYKQEVSVKELTPNELAEVTTGLIVNVDVDKKYNYGDTITAVKQLNVSDSDTPVLETILSYEWNIKYTDGTTKKIPVTSNELEIPIEAQGAKIELLAKSSKGNYYKQEVTIDELSSTEILFSDLSSEKQIEKDAYVNVNTPISAKINRSSETVTKYEWYINSGNIYQKITSETDMLIDVPITASGKNLVLIVSTESGKKFRGNLKVNKPELGGSELSVKLNDKVITNTSDVTLVENDKLSVSNVIIKGSNQVQILPSQAVISYQWYYVNKDTKSLISGATSATYTIPKDAAIREYKGYQVKVKIELPDVEGAVDYIYSDEYGYDKTPAEKVKGDIGNLSDGKQYKSDIKDLKSQIESIETAYGKLTSNSKLIVDNYQKLLTAKADITTVEPIITTLEKFNEQFEAFDIESTDEAVKKIKHAELLKQFTAINEKYTVLTSLQRSLLIGTTYNQTYMADMFDYLNNINDNSEKYKSAKAVSTINGLIQALFSGSDVILKQYNLNNRTLKEFELDINNINDLIKTIDKNYQSIIKTDVLKTALSDIKKARAVEVKIEELANLSGAKQVKAADSVKKAYDKLTFSQKSLIANPDLLETIKEDEASLVETLKEDIDKLASSENKDSISGSIENDINNLLDRYKNLDSKSKKLVTNYAKLTQAKKDLSVARKLINSLNIASNAYDVYTNATDEKEIKKTLSTAFSKHQSVYKTYIKFNPLQQSLLENSSELNTTINEFLSNYEELAKQKNLPKDDDSSTSDPNEELKYDQSKVDKIVKDLNGLNTSVTTNVTDLKDVIDTIEAIKLEYKALKALEKKNVHNYAILSMADAVAKKSRAVQNSLKAALTSTKLVSAISAYEKLTIAQQDLISEDYEDALTRLDELLPEYKEKDTLFDVFVDLSYTIDIIKNTTEAVKAFSSKDLKNIPNYQAYQDALKNQKAVEAFVKKMDKLVGTPTYSKVESILKDFNKLTFDQANLFEVSYSDKLAKLESWKTTSDQSSTTLNNEIGNFIKSGEYTIPEPSGEGLAYLEEFDQHIKDLEARYKALDSKEKKLVTHYSFLKTATKDSKAVKPVINFAIQFESASEDKKKAIYQQWESAYNRLSVQQKSIFDKAIVNHPTSN